MTRRFRPEQMELGEVPSEDIYINPRSRDDVPKILRGIRSLVSNRNFRFALERLLTAGFLPSSDSGQGRPGMDLRRIFALGVLKQGPGCDFDRLPHRANEDKLVRKFLGHADFVDVYECKRQTLADNTPVSRVFRQSQFVISICGASHKFNRIHGFNHSSRHRADMGASVVPACQNESSEMT